MDEDVVFKITLTRKGDIVLSSNAPNNLVIYSLLAGAFEALLTQGIIDRITQSKIVRPTDGDIHDIGKNMLKMVFDIAGFTLRDLGRDTSISRFVEEVVELDSPLVLISCMLSTCGPRVEELISRLKEEAPNAIIMAGGAFIDDRASKRMGAHGGARNAHNALREAIRMLSAVNKI